MGNTNASIRKSYEEAITQLSSVQLNKITEAYKELHSRGGRKGGLVDRSLFTSYFDVSPVLSERLFEAFDRKKNGLVDFEEFVCGVTLMLHGSFEDKCKLLFDVFNIAGDEGVSYEELTCMLSAIAVNTDLILTTFHHPSSSALLEPETSQQAVKRIADAAFEKCDITGSGKLLPLEFQYWLEQNPQILNTLLPLSNKSEVSSSNEEMSEVMMIGQAVVSEPRVTGDHRVEVINDQSVSQITEDVPNQDVSKESSDQDIAKEVGDQASMEPVSTQEIIGSVTDQDVNVSTDQGVTELTGNVSQGVDEIVNTIDDDTIVDQAATGQDTDKTVDIQEQLINQEIFDDQRADETVTSQIKEAVSDQEFEVTDLITTEGINNVQTTGEEIDNQNIIATNAQPPVTDQSGLMDDSHINQSPARLPSVHILQDPASPDLVDTPHHSRGMLEQEDIWQASFILTQPSCINCPSELRSLWREPVMDSKVSTQPLQHYTSSLNSDQVLSNVAAVSMDIAGFKELLARGQYPAALELSGRFLAAHGQSHTSTGSSLHTEQTLAMWSGRLVLLYRLGYYRECASELEHFKGFNQSDLFYQSYPNRYGDQRGSMTPFMLRLLDAELPLYCRDPNTALDRLFLLKGCCEKLLLLLGDNQPDATALWRNRHAHVMLSIGNCLLSIQEYTLAIDVYKQLSEMLPERLRPTIISAIGRIHLLLGDVGAAKECFAAVTSSQPEQEQLQNQLNRVAVMVFQSAYSEAYDLTQKMLQQHCDNLLVLNNAAVCAFYTGRQQEAMQLLQRATKLHTSEAISVNMKAIYDLEVSGYQAENKRRSTAQLPRV